MKSPCVKECPDRLPGGACRKSCEAFKGRFELRVIGRPPQSWCYVEAM